MKCKKKKKKKNRLSEESSWCMENCPGGNYPVGNCALLWQKEASDKSDISCKRAKCVCHFH